MGTNSNNSRKQPKLSQNQTDAGIMILDTLVLGSAFIGIQKTLKFASVVMPQEVWGYVAVFAVIYAFLKIMAVILRIHIFDHFAKLVIMLFAVIPLTLSIWEDFELNLSVREIVLKYWSIPMLFLFSIAVESFAERFKDTYLSQNPDARWNFAHWKRFFLGIGTLLHNRIPMVKIGTSSMPNLSKVALAAMAIYTLINPRLQFQSSTPNSKSLGGTEIIELNPDYIKEFSHYQRLGDCNGATCRRDWSHVDWLTYTDSIVNLPRFGYEDYHQFMEGFSRVVKHDYDSEDERIKEECYSRMENSIRTERGIIEECHRNPEMTPNDRARLNSRLQEVRKRLAVLRFLSGSGH